MGRAATRRWPTGPGGLGGPAPRSESRLDPPYQHVGIVCAIPLFAAPDAQSLGEVRYAEGVTHQSPGSRSTPLGRRASRHDSAG